MEIAFERAAVRAPSWTWGRQVRRLRRFCPRPPVDEDLMVPLAGNIVFVGYLFAKDIVAFL